MTTNSRRYFTTATAAVRYLVSQGFELADSRSRYGWANFGRQMGAGIRVNSDGFFIRYSRI